MRKNTAGQVVAFQAVSTTDGSAVTTGTPVVYYTIDGGTQGTGAGASTHEGNGCWSYAPAQAETNGNHVVFTFALTGAVSQSVNLYPVAFDPTDSVRIGMTALPNAAAGAAGGLPTDSTGKTAFSDLDAAGVRTAIGLASANLDTQLGDLPTVAEFEARTILASAYFDPAADAVANVTTVGSVSGSVTVGTNNDKTDYALSETSRDAITADFLAHVITKGSAGTIERAFWQAAKAQASASGEVSGTPTVSAFDTDLTATSGAFDHLLIVFTSGSLTGEARPIDTYVNANGRITLQEALTAAPSSADEFLIVPSHVHPISEIQSGLATAANQTTILNRLGSWTGSGLNTILGAFRAIAGKAASLTPSDLSDGTTFDNTDDSLEAIRDRGDAAWAPGEAGSGDASQSTLLAVQDQVEAIAGTLGGTAISVTSRIADGGAMVIYTGDDLRVRSGTQVTVSISDPAGGIYSRLSALGTSQLSWGAARQSQAAGAISGTISSLTQSGSGDAQVVNLVIEILDAGQSLNPADDYIWQVASTSSSGDEYTEIEGTLDLRRRVAVPVTA